MGKWNVSGFRPPLCTYRLNWARRTSWGWWDDWDDTFLQTQDSKFEPWRSEAEHATSRSRRLPTILTFTRGWGRNNFVSFKPPRPGTEPRTLAWKAAVLTTTLGPPPSNMGRNKPGNYLALSMGRAWCPMSKIQSLLIMGVRDGGQMELMMRAILKTVDGLANALSKIQRGAERRREGRGGRESGTSANAHKRDGCLTQTVQPREFVNLWKINNGSRRWNDLSVKHNTLSQCYFNAWPSYMTMAQL